MDLPKSTGCQTHVALRVAKELLLRQGKDSNVIFSPLSIHIVLSLLTAGSNGATRDQLLSFLNSKSTDQINSSASEFLSILLADSASSGGPLLSFANGVWVDQSFPLNPSFKKVVDTSYKAAIAQVDFQTSAAKVRRAVNSWAEKETNGLIKVVLPPDSVDSSTSLILANAVYFKGNWDEKFMEILTQHHKFHLLNGSCVQAPFMRSFNRQLVAAFEGFKVLSLPYKRGKDKRSFSMHIFLPDSTHGLPALIENLGSESGFLEQHLPCRLVSVGDFRIPRFKLCFAFEASDLLKELGLVLPFSEGGFSDMVDSPLGSNFFVSGIFQNSFIEVNEQGTEAAAATALRMAGGCCPGVRRERIDFVADHPFLFLIRENTSGTLVFAGQVLNPLAG